MMIPLLVLIMALLAWNTYASVAFRFGLVCLGIVKIIKADFFVFDI